MADPSRISGPMDTTIVMLISFTRSFLYRARFIDPPVKRRVAVDYQDMSFQ